MFGAEWERARDIFYAEVRGLPPRRAARRCPARRRRIAAAGALGAAGGGVSNKQGALLRAEAAHLGWAAHFGALVGAGDASADKPDPAPLLLALDRLGVPAWPAGLVRRRHRARHAGGARGGLPRGAARRCGA